ncbi:MAG: DUF4440 domain-containing protein, partial [Acidobacteria bacterium]
MESCGHDTGAFPFVDSTPPSSIGGWRGLWLQASVLPLKSSSGFSPHFSHPFYCIGEMIRRALRTDCATRKPGAPGIFTGGFPLPSFSSRRNIKARPTKREKSKMKTWITLFVISMFTTVVALAGDVDDVRAAEDNYYAAMISGDARGWAQSRLSEESTRFGPGGALLEVFGSLEEQEQIRKAEFDAGLKYNLRARHRDIRVYGNTAVVTLYGVGAVSNNPQVHNRITRVWGKQSGQWKMIH